LFTAGCFDPDLGTKPFKCAPSGQECPEGYHCEPIRGTRVCISDDVNFDSGVKEDTRPTDGAMLPSKEGPVFVDGAPVKSSTGCDDESSEPNNTAADATDLNFAGSGEVPGWHICYTGDVDQYALDLDEGQKLVVDVRFAHSEGDLEAALLDPDGEVIDASRSVTDDEQVAITSTAKQGTYIIAVWGFGPATNKYDLYIDKQ
jgi:hypothetical protein